jgi:hypothetical protein
VTEKTCPGCGVTKSLDEFYRQRKNKDGRQSRCKECQLTYQREHAEGARERARRWRRKRGVKPRKNQLGGEGTLFPDLKEK